MKEAGGKWGTHATEAVSVENNIGIQGRSPNTLEQAERNEKVNVG